MLGFTTIGELGEMRMQDIYPPETAKLVRETGLPQALLSGTWMAEIMLRARSGREIPVSQVLVAHKTETGKVNFLSTIMRDLTERNKLEEQFRQSQKMEAIGILAGGIAHDFNNILTVILGFGEMLIERMPETNPDRELVAEMTKAGNRAAALTRQLLAFSRQSVLGVRQLDLNVAATEVEKMLRRMIGEDVELVMQLQPGLGRIKADPGQIDQILMNLAVNARDAMPQGGRLTIATKDVVLGPDDLPATGELQPGPYVLLTIGDTGLGMTEEVKARIFEPFFTTKEKGRGTGLGLAMTYGAVRQNHGFIDLDTAPGQGTTFRIYLPESREAERPESSGTPLPRPIGGETILLVEDEAGVRAMIRMILEMSGYRVLEAAGGQEAVELAAGYKDTIHLILTDVVMPGQGGRAVAERVLERHPGAKVLYLSGYLDDAVVRYGVLTDSMNFLAKPFTPDSLARKVSEVLAASE